MWACWSEFKIFPLAIRLISTRIHFSWFCCYNCCFCVWMSFAVHRNMHEKAYKYLLSSNAAFSFWFHHSFQTFDHFLHFSLCCRHKHVHFSSASRFASEKLYANIMTRSTQSISIFFCRHSFKGIHEAHVHIVKLYLHYWLFQYVKFCAHCIHFAATKKNMLNAFIKCRMLWFVEKTHTKDRKK